MTKVLHDFFDAQTWLIIGTITVVSIGMVQGGLITSFCSAPANADGSGGFLSLSKCCHDPEDCWMDEGYPAVCNEPRLTSAVWRAFRARACCARS